MNTNLFTSLVLQSALLLIGSCQEVPTRDYQLRVEVVDDQGRPVADAVVQCSRDELVAEAPIATSKPVQIRTPTDESGLAVVLMKSVHPPGGVAITKDGFYLTTASVPWAHPDGFEARRRTAEIQAVLRPVKNPIPMVALKDIRLRTPKFGTPYGFDLEMGEALPPFGRGKIGDIEFTLAGNRRDLPGSDREFIDLTMTIRCPNEGDGFVEFTSDNTDERPVGSFLTSLYEAPAKGYDPEFKRTAKTEADGGFSRMIATRQLDAKKCCYFRVRTRKDADGSIISAHYGKLYGPLEIRPAFKQYGHDVSKGQGGFFIGSLYFNPKPNDRNVEFDPKRNLDPEGGVGRP